MRPVIHASPSVPDTGWGDFSHLLTPGLVKSTSNGRCNLRRRGDRMMADMALTVFTAGMTTILILPPEYRPDVPVLLPFTYWTAPQQNVGLPSTVKGDGYLGGGGSSIRVGTGLALGTISIYLDLPASGPMP